MNLSTAMRTVFREDFDPKAGDLVWAARRYAAKETDTRRRKLVIAALAAGRVMADWHPIRPPVVRKPLFAAAYRLAAAAAITQADVDALLREAKKTYGEKPCD